MEILHTIQDMRDWRGPAGMPLAFVPTMGALHEGHASLVRRARAMADARREAAGGEGGAGAAGRVAASIFVNPTQFGPSEDFAKYPRTLDEDAVILAAAGCDAVFVPSVEEMYGSVARLSTEAFGQMASIDPGPLGALLEGEIRPGHFRGVCTVVAKLLNIVQPTHLLLGQKDFQQQAVLRQMCADLNMPVEVVTGATLRAGDGLAMSSRNRYLSVADRPRATALFAALNAAEGLFRGGERHAAPLEAAMRRTLEAGGLQVQYAVVRNVAKLAAFADVIDAPAVALIAAKLGNTRLIDNMLLDDWEIRPPNH